MRTIPPQLLDQELESFDDAVMKALEIISVCKLSDTEKLQSTFAISAGGLGLRKSSLHKCAAYISSYSSCRESTLIFTSYYNKRFLDSIQYYNNKVLEPIPFDSIETLNKKQKELSKNLEAVLYQDYKGSLPHKDKARLLSEATKRSGAWLRVTPDYMHSFSPREFTTLIKMWLGADVYPQDPSCRKCHKPMDTKGLHATICSTTGDRIQRHNAVNSVIFEYAKKGALNPFYGQLHLFGPNDNRLPADTFIPNYQNNKQAAFDVGITHPHREDNVANSALIPNHAATKYRLLKIKKYQEAANKVDLTLIPVCIETFGAIDPIAQEALEFILKAAGSRLDIKKADVAKAFYDDVSFILQKYNANMIISRDTI